MKSPAATVLRRRRPPVEPVQLVLVAPEPAPPLRGWTNLHRECIGEFRRLGVVDVEAGRRRT